jgi:hypothetical protein
METDIEFLAEQKAIYDIACFLCERDGHENPHEMIYEGPLKEPWGELWQKYEEEEAKTLYQISHPIMPSKLAFAPWTDEQILTLARRQSLNSLHPYTYDGRLLVPTKEGWKTQEGQLSQRWCHIADLDVERIYELRQKEQAHRDTLSPTEEIEVKPFTECPNCSQQRFDNQIERAKYLQTLGATDIVVYYDDHEDYMRIDFTLHGTRFLTRIYKNFTVHKEGFPSFTNRRSFSQAADFLNFFKLAKHLAWETQADELS